MWIDKVGQDWKLLRKASEDVRRVLRVIASLPTRRHCEAAAAEAGDGDGETCAICLGDFEEGEEVRLLPCLHEFCKGCIDLWIERQGLAAACPLCKRALIPPMNQPIGAPAESPAAASDETRAAGEPAAGQGPQDSLSGARHACRRDAASSSMSEPLLDAVAAPAPAVERTHTLSVEPLTSLPAESHVHRAPSPVEGQAANEEPA